VITLLLVDDHRVVRYGLKRLLEDTPGFKIIGEASTGEEALALSRQLVPDVILMDISMPGIGGLEATVKLRRFHPDTKIVIITAREDLFFTERLFQAGAVGYLTKGAPAEDIIRAIKVVHLGQRYIAPAIATQLATKQLDHKGTSPFEQLSERELQVSLMVVKGIRVPTIAKQLCISPKTVNTYRYRVFDKLAVKSDVELTHSALQYGLLEEPVKNAVQAVPC
jgi:two-component system invasion response regulator UvrY